MPPIPSRTLAARVASRLRAVALVALLLTNVPPALAQSTAAPVAASAEQAAPQPPARPRLAAAGVTASMTDAPLGDANGNGGADPGETLRYTTVISNSSGADILGVSFDDTLDPNTSLVAGSLRISPLAFADTYNASRDTPLAVGAPGILANDTGTPAPTITPRSVTTAAGGSATTNADGGFSYAPPPGYTGIDSFSYIASNSVGADTGVVTINVRAAPAAADDSYTVARDTSRTVLAPGVLSNDSGFPPPAATPLSGPTTSGGTVNLVANGGFSYTPPAGFTGADTFVYTAVNSAGADTATVTMTVGIAPVALNDAYVTSRDTPLSVPVGGLLLNDTPGSPPATLLSFGGGALAGTATSNPAGATVNFAGGGSLTVGADGGFVFSPSTGFAGTFSFGYRIGNVFGTSDGVATISVQQIPAITSTDTVTFTVGAAGTFAVTATGFPTPTLAIGGDALPSGVTFVDNGDGTGTLSGTPGAGTAGTYNLIFTASNAAGSSAPQSFTLTVQDGPIVTSASAATFTAGTPGSFTVAATGFPTPTLAIGGDALPAGVTFVDNGDGTGTLSGTPGAGSGGVYILTFTASNSAGSSTPQQFTLTVEEAPAITSTDTLTLTVGAPGSFAVTATGFPTPTLAIGGDALPAGVTFVDNGDGTGTLAGTPGSGTGGVYALTFTANSSAGASPTQSFTLTVLEAPAITSTTVAPFQIGAAGSFTITTSGYPTPTIDLTGALPAGVTFVDNGNGTGTLAGTPTASGSFALTLTADNGVGSPVPQSFTLVVGQAAAISSAATTNFTPGVFSSFTVTTVGFPAPSIAIGGAALPAGVTFVDNGDGTGTLSGTPGAAAAGSHALTFTATNSSGSSPAQSFTLTVGTPPAITSANSAAFAVGAAGSFTVATSGLPAPAIAIGGAALPTGVTFTDNGDGTGTLAGTPGAGTAGSYAISFTATNVVGSSAAQSFTLSVNQAPAITSASSASFPIGAPSSFGVTTTGFPTPTLTLGGVALPAGVTFTDNGDGTGTLAGTPGAGTVGDYALTFTAANGVTPNALQNFTLSVTCPVIAVAPAAGALTDGLYGTAYSQAFTPSGGTGPYSFDLASGSVPGGLTLAAGGTLAGTPSGATGTGSFSFTVRATDAFGCQGSTAYTLLVRPDAQNESYGGGVGNTQFVVGAPPPAFPFVFATGSVLANDAGAGTLSVAVLSNPTNGALTLNSDGTFVYTPNVNFAGPSDSFTYTLTDGNGATNTATATINLSGRIWYVDSSGVNGDGRSHSPFNALNNAQAPSSNGDTIFVHTGSGTTPGGITLKPSQVLWGQGTAYTLNNLTIAAGAKPTVNGTVVLANNVVVSSLDINTAGANAMTGSGATGVTVQNNVALSSTGAAALSLSNASGSMAFASITASGGANGISLTNVGGTLTSAGGSLSNSTGALFNVSGGNGTIAYAGSVSQSSGARLADIQTSSGGVTLSGSLACNTACTGINVASNTGGTIDFSGASKALTTGASTAVTLANNTGATISFTSGGLAISTTSGAGFSATGGGTVNVTGANNTIASTTGTALNVTNTTIGAGGLTFQSVSANGGTNGIVLNNTGTSGGLTITGAGATDGSGGTIQNTTTRGASFTSAQNITLKNMNFSNAATTQSATNCANLSLGGNSNLGCNAPIHLDSVTNATLDNLNINGSAQQGINGRSVTNFALSNSVITAIGGAADEDGIHFLDMLGISSITNTSVTGSFDDNMIIQNVTPGTNGTLTVTGSTFSTSAQGSGIVLGARGTGLGASLTVNVISSIFDNNFSGAIPGTASDNGTLDVEVTGSTITNNNDGLDFSATQTADTTFDIHDNQPFTGQDFLNVSILGGAFGSGTVQGNIRNNIFNTANGRTTDSLSIFQAGGGALKVAVSNNMFNYGGTQRAILMQGGQDGNGSLDATLTGNTLDVQLDGAGNAVTGILAQTAITGPGNTTSVCADIGGAGALANTFTHSLGGVMAGGDVRVRQRNDGTVRLPSYGGAATDTAAVTTYLGGRNTIVSPSTATADSTGFAGGGACAQPVLPAGRPVAGNTIASPAPQAGAVTANIGTIPAGKQVTVIFDVLIASPLPVGVGQLSNQGTVSGAGLAELLTDDPRKPGAADPTITRIGVRKLYLSLVMQGAGAGPPLPDLVVSSIETANGGLRVTIRNIGQAPATAPFWVDAYINPAVAPTRVNQLWNSVGTRGATWGVVGSVLPLEVGESLTLTLSDGYYRPELSNPGGAIAAGTRLYAQADSFNGSSSTGAVLESHERDGGLYNNILGPVVP